MDKRYMELTERELSEICEKIRIFELGHNKRYSKEAFREVYGDDALAKDIPEASETYERGPRSGEAG
jgi:DNA-directed RNA polymerase beta' subunit